MGTIASQENPDSGPLSEEGERATILAAARKLAARDGVLEMTLTGVAREAGVAPTAIYTFFSSKNDLLQAVVADDLATLAKTMRRALVPPGDGETGEPPAVNSPTPLLLLTTEAAEEAPAAESQHTATQDSHDTGTPAQAQELPRRYPVVQARREPVRSSAPEPNGTADAIARLQEAVAKLEARPVDAWLERRLRVFERELAALQSTHAERAAPDTSAAQGPQDDLRGAIAALEQRQTTAVEDSVHLLSGQLDALAMRLRETGSDLQAESVHLARRVTALENLAFASRPEMTPPPVEFAPLPEAAQPSPPLAENEATDEERQAINEPLPSYLTAARRSAQAAAQASEEYRQKTPGRKPKTMLYATCGSLLLFVVLASGLMLRDSTMNAQPVHVAAKPAHVARMLAPARFVRAAPARPVPRLAQAATQPSLRQLADGGDASAELLLGLQYLEGKGVAKNEAMAVDWLSRAAAKGQPVAQYDLGALYADGRGVRPDAVQAFQWFGAAALHGNRRAMHFLAIAYAEGIGTTKNLPEAARWFERSATLGAVNSQFNLAVLYERGMGVQQSLPTAYKWYMIAAAQGDRESQARIAALASELKPADLADAKSAAQSYQPEALDPAANLPPKLPS